MSDHRNMPWNDKVTKGHIIDAIGGGLCKKHGEYFGTGKHGLRACPFCDIEAYFEKVEKEAVKEATT